MKFIQLEDGTLKNIETITDITPIRKVDDYHKFEIVFEVIKEEISCPSISSIDIALTRMKLINFLIGKPDKDINPDIFKLK